MRTHATPTTVCLYRTFRSRQTKKYSSSRYAHTSRTRSSKRPRGGSIRIRGSEAASSGEYVSFAVSAVSEPIPSVHLKKNASSILDEAKQCCTLNYEVESNEIYWLRYRDAIPGFALREMLASLPNKPAEPTRLLVSALTDSLRQVSK